MGYIDGLRALAVVSVVIHHASLHSPACSALLKTFPCRALLEGAHGVDLFFVLSGFCLAHPTLRKLREDGIAAFDAASYAAKRLARIVPPYYAAIVLFCIFSAALHEPVALADVAKQVLFFDWQTHFLNGSFWSLIVEFRWYFVFPLALFAYVRFPKLTVAAAIAAPVLYNATRLHAVDVGTLMPFVLGIVAADIAIRRHALTRFAPQFAMLALLAGLLAEPYVTETSPYGYDLPIFFAQINPGWQVAAFFAVVWAGTSPLLQRALGMKPLVATGIASYSIYLVHEPLIAFVEARVAVPPFAAGAIAAAAAVAFGFAFWAVAERPWTDSVLRARTLDALRPRMLQALAGLGVPARVRLASGLHEPEIEAA